MPLKIKLLGEFSLLADGQRIQSGHSSLLAYLSLRHPIAVSRSELAASLYPLEPRSTALNRLRVGLARIKQVVPVVITGETVALAPEAISIDLVELRSAMASATESVTTTEEFQALKSLWPQLNELLLVGFDAEWAEDERTAWALEVAVALARLSHLAADRGDFATSKAACESGLKLLPSDDELWLQYLSVSARCGQVQTALRKWERCRRKLIRDGEDFSRDLIESAEQYREPDLGSGFALSVAQEEIVRRWATRVFEEDSELTIKMLASNAFLPEIARKPIESSELLRFALSRPTGKTFDSERCAVNLVRAQLMVENLDALKDADSLLAENLYPDNRRLLLLNTSFVRFFYGQPRLAMLEIEECIALCHSLGLEFEVWLARCQYASFLWTDQKLEASATMYRQAIDYFQPQTLRNAANVMAIVMANYSAVLMELNEFGQALALALDADQLARRIGAPDAEARAASTVARASFPLSQDAQAFEASCRAIKRAHRLGVRRLQVNVLEFIALGIVLTDHREKGRELLRHVWSLRAGCGLPHDMVFGSWFERFLPGETMPEPSQDVAGVLVATFRELSAIRRAI